MSGRDGRVAIVTGASRGIGEETAVRAAARGFDVAVAYHRDAEAAERVVGRIAAAGRRAIFVQCDVANEEDVEALFAQVDDRLGRPHALVNNAGILFDQRPVAEMSAERVARVLAVNVTGSLLCAREAVRRMSTARGGDGGVIVNVSSAAARLGSPHEYVDYAASKGAIDTFTVGLAKEVATEGIRVACVRPGIIETEIHARGGDPGRIERLQGAIPMQRAGRAHEVADAILWLLSDEATYATGAILDVAGGR